MGVYEVAEFRLGDRKEGDIIIFASVEDMENAYKDIDNGKDIYIKKDGIVTKILQQMITNKIYDGTIVLSAKVKKGEKIGEDQ